MKRIALIYDDRLRPETTGLYCRRAFSRIADVVHFRPEEIHGIRPRDHDLFVCIDDGLDYAWRDDLHPSVYWAIDTHVGFERCLSRAKRVDHVFAAQRDGAHQLRQVGISRATWLPLACDPEIHGKQFEPKRLDICFIGNVLAGIREERLGALRRAYPNMYVGKHFFEDMARVHSQTRVIFNQSIASDVNMRVFEALASGSLLVTNDLAENGLAELFQDGVHLVTFRDTEELIAKVDYYLTHEEARERIASTGRKAVLSAHSYDHRVATMLEVVADRGPLNPTPAEMVESRDISYYQHTRPELLELIPRDARSVLDIGCGAGMLGAALKQRQSARVVGLERDPRAASLARGRLDGVIERDLESEGWDFSAASFDAIVCGDIVEHLADPLAFLRRARQWLQPAGALILSVPNVRHHTVLLSLLDGNFTYESAGLLDQDHVQFFTRRRLDRLLELSGFEAEIREVSVLPGDVPLRDSAISGTVTIGELHLDGLDAESAQDLFVYQFLVRARPIRGVLSHPAASEFMEFGSFPSPNEGHGGVASTLDPGMIHDPLALLRETRECLGREDRRCFRFRTCRNHRFVSRLLLGDWDQPLEHGVHAWPLRFFTRREMEKLLFRGGWEIEGVTPVPTEDWRAWRANGSPPFVAHSGLSLAVPSSEDAEEFHVEEYAVTARTVLHFPRELTSVVIVTHNQWEYTRQCLDGIRMRTDEPIEIIVVDNASTDDTVSRLRERGDVLLIENATNRGFPAAANQGISAARGAYVLLLNNDVVVTTGWLRRLLDAFACDSNLGLVGPCSNCVSGEQRIEVGYNELSSLDGWAWGWSKRHRGEKTLTDRLVGFCLLIRREVVDAVGLLDERFGVGCFEDDDFCRRALLAGYRAAIVWDSFVHHFGSRTFLGSGVPFAGILEENRRRYLEKWSELDKCGEIDPPAGHTEEGGTTRDSEIHVSLCMIARNNEATIGPALSSIRPWVDEMIVVDTGSDDRTPEIARESGARVHEFPWCDDFSAARNRSLLHARGEWILWMDSDDVIDEANGRKLQELLRRPADPLILGYVLQVHCPAPEENGGRDVTAVDHVKLIRNRGDIRFEGRIHEQVLPSIRRAGGEVAWTDIFVVHAGADHSPEGRQRKLERDFRILARDLEERPDHPFVLFNLGMTHADAGQQEDAIRVLTRCLEVSDESQSHLRKAYSILVGALVERKRFDEALAACHRGRRLFPRDAELLFREAMLHHHFGRLTEAETLYRQILTHVEERHFSSMDRGLTGHKARHNLARVHEDQGELDAAEREWRKICAEQAGYSLGWHGLGEVLLRQGKRAEAIAEGKEWCADERLSPEVRREGYLLVAKAFLAEGDVGAAERTLAEAMNHFPDDPEPLRAWCRLLFDYAEPSAAVTALHELTKRDPEDAAAHHNLGTAYLRVGETDRAVDSFRQSLCLRPNSPITSLHLGYALRKAGAIEQAEEIWRAALRSAPDHEELKAALESHRV